MCGICGIIDFTGRVPSHDVTYRMTQAIANRGPDGQGVKTAPFCGFGHRRLAIIDLSEEASQPMHDGDESIWITFNGEIYNYLELRHALEKEGVVFRTKSDTEVLIKGYQHWGMNRLLQQARGIWAFALWDLTKKTLYLSRDRFGKKPLYFVKQGEGVIFASSLRSIRQAIELHKLDFQAIASFLSLTYIPPDQCVFQNVKKVPAGSWMAFTYDKEFSQSYWSLEYHPVRASNIQEVIDETDRLLSLAIEDRLVADVDVGAFLSGGLDSGLVTAMMATKKSHPKTFTMKALGSWRDESQRARIVVDYVNSKHLEIPVTANDLQILPWLIYQYGEPFADSSMIPTALVARKASKYVKVVLTGDGGDETFGGYGEPLLLRRLLNYRNGIPNSLAHLIGALGLQGFHCLPQFLTGYGRFFQRYIKVFHTGLSGYLQDFGAVDRRIAKIVFGPSLLECYTDENAPTRYLAIAPNAPDWKRLLWVQNQLRLQGDFLVKIDVATMAFGLEARCPYLDHRLMEFVFGLPWEVWQLNNKVKGILRALVGRYLPSSFLMFPKHGFSIPCEDYIFGPWASSFMNMLNGGISEQFGMIKPDGVKWLMNHFHTLGQRRNNIVGLLFAIFCLEIWLRVSYAKTDAVADLSQNLAVSLPKQPQKTISEPFPEVEAAC